jgi:hypothetical protein
MKRIAVAVIIVVLCVFQPAAAESSGDDATPSNAILLELSELAISFGGQSWLVGIAAEYQRVLGNHLVLSLIPELTVGSDTNKAGALLGLVVHPFGGGLRGMFIGAYPGFTCESRSVHFVAEADVGYQWVLDHGIVVHLSIGGRQYGRIGITRSGSFRIGFAF